MADDDVPPAVISKFNSYGEWIKKRAEAPGRLFEHQLEALNALVSFFKLSKAGEPALVSLPTGTGKTGVIALAPYYLATIEKTLKSVLIITPDNYIARQVNAELTDHHAGKTFYGKRDLVPLRECPKVLPTIDLRPKSNNWTPMLTNKDIVITNAQKFHCKNAADSEPLWRTLPQGLFQLVIVDEAHHFPSTFWYRAITHFKESKVVFLTATPYRTDGQTVIATRPAYYLSRADAIARGIIRGAEFISLPLSDHYKSLPEDQKEECAWKEILIRMQQRLNDADAVEPLPGGKVHQALVVALTMMEAEKIAILAKNLGISAASYVGKGKGQHRTLVLFKAQSIRMLVICRKLLEGFDHPPISIVGILENLRSSIKFSQFVGRGVRKIREGATIDQSMVWIITHDRYNQRVNFDQYTSEKLIREAFDDADAEDADADCEDEDDKDSDIGS